MNPKDDSEKGFNTSLDGENCEEQDMVDLYDIARNAGELDESDDGTVDLYDLVSDTDHMYVPAPEDIFYFGDVEPVFCENPRYLPPPF